MGTGMFLSWSILVIHFRIVTKSASIILCYIMEEEVFELFLLLSIFVILDFFLNSLRGHPLSTSPSRLEDGVTDLVVIWGHCIFWPFFGDMVDGEGRVKKREKSGDILKGWPLTVQLQSWYQCPMISNSERINFEKKILHPLGNQIFTSYTNVLVPVRRQILFFIFTSFLGWA